MAAISSFVNRTLPDVYGAPLPLVEQVIIESIKRFVDQTWAVSEGFSVVADTVDSDEIATLDLSAFIPTGHKITDIKTLKLEGTPQYLFLHDIQGEGVTYLSPGNAKFFEISGNAEILLFPAGAGDVYHGQVVCIPQEGCTDVADELFDEWVEGIVCLAKARLFKMPNKEWTNYDLVKPNTIEARRIMVRANKKINKNRTGNSLSVKPRDFING